MRKPWTVSPSLREQIYERDLFRCRYCYKYIAPGDPFHADHVIPYSRGGPTALRNLVLACPPCNLRKHAQVWEPLPIFPIDFDSLPPEVATALRMAVRDRRAAELGHVTSFIYGRKGKRIIRWSCSCGKQSMLYFKAEVHLVIPHSDHHKASAIGYIPTDNELEESLETGRPPGVSRPPWL